MKKRLVIKLLFTIVLVACSEKQQVAGKTSSQSASKGGAGESRAESIVKKNCKVCHAQGINGAPIIGNKKMWAQRKDKSLETLVNNAKNGVGLMPAKGGNLALSDEELELAITYMLESVN